MKTFRVRFTDDTEALVEAENDRKAREYALLAFPKRRLRSVVFYTKKASA